MVNTANTSVFSNYTTALRQASPRGYLLLYLNTSLSIFFLMNTDQISKNPDGELLVSPDGKNVILFDDFWKNPEKYHHPIKWYVNVMNIGKRNFNLGYCEYGKGTAFIASDGVTPLIVADVTVVGDFCSDSKWCVNLACPFNRAEIKYMRKYGVKNKEDLQKLHERMKEIEKKLDEIGLSFENAKCGIHLFKKPVIHIEKKR